MRAYFSVFCYSFLHKQTACVVIPVRFFFPVKEHENAITGYKEKNFEHKLFWMILGHSSFERHI